MYVVGSATGDSIWGENGQNNNSVSGASDAFITALKTNGNEAWTTLIGDENDDFGYAVTIGSYNNVYVAGRYTDIELNAGPGHRGWDAFLTRVDGLEGTVLWTQYYGS